MSLVDRVAARLAALRDGLPVDALHTVAAGLDDVVRDLGALADGSDSPHLTDARAAFHRARVAVDDVLVAVRALTEHLTDYRRALGISDGLQATAFTRPMTAPVRSAASDQDTTARQLLDELPLRGPREKTRGVWVDEEGEKHPLISGEHEAWYERANEHAKNVGLIPEGRRALAVASHVEVKFAMRMRANNIRKATIVVNKSPCEGLYGCHERLWEFLPGDAELTVYGPDGFRHTYRGRRKKGS